MVARGIGGRFGRRAILRVRGRAVRRRLGAVRGGVLLAVIAGLAACGDAATSGGAPGPAEEGASEVVSGDAGVVADAEEVSADPVPEPPTSAPSHPGDGDAAPALPDAPADGAPAVTAAPLSALPIVEPTWPDHLAEIVAEARDEFRVPTVTVRGRAKLPPGLIVVDVRAAEEAAVSAVPGARLLDSKAKRRAFLEEEHEQPVLVYCTAGWRSAEFTRDLRAAGVDAYNLEGGLCAWALYGQALVDAAGEPTKRVHGYSKDWADCVPPGYEAVW